MLHSKCGAEKSIVLGREVEQDLERCSSRIEWRRGARSADAESGGAVEGGPTRAHWRGRMWGCCHVLGIKGNSGINITI
jgi:hypothetical protein